MSEYYYSLDGAKRLGPVSGKQLKQLADEGVLARNSLVWKDGLADWVPAERLRGLFGGPGAPHAHGQESPHAFTAIPPEQTDTAGYGVEPDPPHSPHTEAGAPGGAHEHEARRWYYLREGEQTGPITRSALVDLLDGKIIAPETYVWSEGMADWRPARNLAELHPPSAHGPGAAQTSSRPVARAATAAGRPSSRYAPAETSGAMRWLLPVDRSPWAIASGYCGLFALFPFCNVLFGPAAIITGIMGLADLRKRTHLTGKPRAITGIVLGILGTGGAIVVVIMMVVGALMS